MSDARATLKSHVHLVKRFIHAVQHRVLPHDANATERLEELNQTMAENAPLAATKAAEEDDEDAPLLKPGATSDVPVTRRTAGWYLLHTL